MTAEVPKLMSLEGRAQMIADTAGRVEHAGNPTARRAAIRQMALQHLQAALSQAGTGAE